MGQGRRKPGRAQGWHGGGGSEKAPIIANLSPPLVRDRKRGMTRRDRSFA
ncbi:uncharacterized protein AruCF_3324 [Achromobacter ruhlandii]|nr:uncharacterized protein AruCF_3324 [Achromobacter ruhlandii]